MTTIQPKNLFDLQIEAKEKGLYIVPMRDNRNEVVYIVYRSVAAAKGIKCGSTKRLDYLPKLLVKASGSKDNK